MTGVRGFESLLAVVLTVLCSRPSVGQARVASAPSEPSLLNLTTGWSRASTLGDLREMRTRSDYLELRVWRGFGESETQAVVVRRANGHWSASFARVIRCEIQIPKSVGDTASVTTMRGYVAEARRACGTSVADVGAGARIITTDTLVVQQLEVPESEIETAWKDALSAGALQLPGRVKHNRTTDDGITYLIELRRGNEYRAAEIEHVEPPEVEADAQVKQIYAAVHRLAQASAPPAASQNPSPMVEETRLHQRLTERTLPGVHRSFIGPDGKPVDLWLPDAASRRADIDLVIHFHGAAWLPEQAVAALDDHTAAAVVNLGVGSNAYHRAFADPAAFDSLLAGVTREMSAVTGQAARIGRLTLVGYSAGHGAVRAILREPRHFARVDAVLLLDGMHTSYVPEGVVLAAGGALDTTNLSAFADYARAAVRGEKRFLVTHSEIFPGTFASTTETADWLLHALGLHRTPVLQWGPVGMQQLSEVRAGHFELLGFAGNTAPDHVDQLHAMPVLLARLLRQ